MAPNLAKPYLMYRESVNDRLLFTEILLASYVLKCLTKDRTLGSSCLCMYVIIVIYAI